MKRPGGADKVLERVLNWRRQVPDLAIRSTFIVGFPGETEEQFEFLLDWMREARIDRAGCFKYENVAHADSRALDGHVAEEVKEERWNRFMEVQAEISAERSKAQIGKIVDVIIDQVDEDQDIAIGRTKADAPEIDGTVELAFGGELEPGMIVEAKVVAADHYDLWAEPA